MNKGEKSSISDVVETITTACVFTWKVTKCYHQNSDCCVLAGKINRATIFLFYEAEWLSFIKGEA